MEIIDFALDDHVAVVSMNSGDNRFNLKFVEAFLDVLDQIENETQAGALVVKSSDPKIWSNGIDIGWLIPAVQKEGPEVAKIFLKKLMEFFRRILTYPMITVAAINGHAFAGGAVMACAFDFRFMRSDRGFFCLNEIDLKMTFLPGMDAIMRKAMPVKYSEMQITGKRLNAQECEAQNIISKACHLDELMDEVMAFAKSMNKHRTALGTMKKVSFAEILRIMDEVDPGYIEDMAATLKAFSS